MNENRLWSVVGPGGGGAQYVPAVSPHDPCCVLVACDMTGAYITHDAGETWRRSYQRKQTRARLVNERLPCFTPLFSCLTTK